LRGPREMSFANLHLFRHYAALWLIAALLVLPAVHAHALTEDPPRLTPARSLEVNGVTINYDASLSPSTAPTLVLIHGFGASLETWNDIYPALRTKYSVVRLDLKGHGFSSKQQYAMEDQARLLAGFITRLGLKRVVLAGHSFGGGVALVTYIHAQNTKAASDIAGLILISSAGYPQELPFFVETLRNPVARFFAYLQPAPTRSRYVLNKIFTVNSRVTPDRVHRYAYFSDLPGSRAALERTARYIVPPNIEELNSHIRNISVPTLILWGAQDTVVPTENALRFNREIKNSRLKMLPQTGHVPQEERPEQVIDTLSEFLSTLR
jgi:pimeloyl-ACP methyl ester carboxylesterase